MGSKSKSFWSGPVGMELSDALLLCASLMATCGSAVAAEKLTEIDANQLVSLRAHSENHAAVGARKMQMLYASNLLDGCASVYMYADGDVAMYITLLAAVTKKTTFDIIYDTDAKKRGTWGDLYSCQLTSVTIKR